MAFSALLGLADALQAIEASAKAAMKRHTVNHLRKILRRFRAFENPFLANTLHRNENCLFRTFLRSVVILRLARDSVVISHLRTQTFRRCLSTKLGATFE